MFFGGKQVIGGHLSIGQFVLFETLLLQLVWPLEALGWITNLAQRALASAGRSFAWLEGIAPLPEPREPRSLPPGPLPVRFEAVRFAYGGEHDVLRELDLAIEPGEIVAVCGPTGRGKTSLLNLLPRFYDPTGGRVLVGGVDTRDVPIAELRSSVALVTQRPVLFSVPLRENLTAGRDDADWDEVLAACAAAGVDTFVDELPDGYDTLIGERGVNLSGGQRQRVALARALITGARVVVLDDPLSAVDTLTERRLVKRLRPALEGRTVLVATQRLSTVELADRAVVLVDGADRRVGKAAPSSARRRAVRGAVRRRGGGGMRRLWRYLDGLHGRAALMVLVAVGNAACQTGGWLLVRSAIDKGIAARNVHYLTVIVVDLPGRRRRRLGAPGDPHPRPRRHRPADRARPAPRPLRPSHRALAPLLLAAEGGLDHRPPHERRRRRLATSSRRGCRRSSPTSCCFPRRWPRSSSPTGGSASSCSRSCRRRSCSRAGSTRVSHVALVETRNRIAAVTAQIAESVSGMAVVQAFNRERSFQAQFDELNAANRVQSIYTQKLFSIFFPSIELLGVFTTGAVLYTGEKLFVHHTLTIGTLITALYLLQLVFQPLQELSDVYGQLQSGAAAMVKIATILDEEPDIRDRQAAEELPRIEGDLEIDHVVFAYGAEPVLRGIDIRIPPGGCLALVGESGHGKSTLARLVGRFYDPDDGAVRVDGVDLRGVKLRSYRRQLGVVLQDPFLFSGTIASNIRFAKPDATDEEVAAAAAAVGVDRVAARLSRGLEHEVREGGAGLSAGERQLISIARALLADPRILILDEATSNIDRPTEVLIERALDRLLAGRTSIIIAHRLSTVRRADEIVVVERGRVVQRGTERELLAQEGPFRNLAHALDGGTGDLAASA